MPSSNNQWVILYNYNECYECSDHGPFPLWRTGCPSGTGAIIFYHGKQWELQSTGSSSRLAHSGCQVHCVTKQVAP